ncbi:Large tegument protein deneddylase [Frankliniella fusca]|uniref:Large tegument protein deneddylase n=1 Tax=Frankliniella fusca TaxID=407009 RepID=A0AAE1LK75_9NEOP|nr:Large tegument protein deneddylase [Frankliniella fusca]
MWITDDVVKKESKGTPSFKMIGVAEQTSYAFSEPVEVPGKQPLYKTEGSPPSSVPCPMLAMAVLHECDEDRDMKASFGIARPLRCVARQ